jgi:hypothetical protein
MKRYSGDPYWTTAKFNSTDANGLPVRKGDRIFYYPASRTVLTGAAADKASAEFSAAAADEAFSNGQTW